LKVSAKVDGKPRPMGDFTFRVKEVPTPVGMIAGVEGRFDFRESIGSLA
jgi:hypothetical protein